MVLLSSRRRIATGEGWRAGREHHLKYRAALKLATLINARPVRHFEWETKQVAVAGAVLILVTKKLRPIFSARPRPVDEAERSSRKLLFNL